MADRLLTDLFGTGTTQTATELRISKTGLASLLSAAGYNFTPTSDNTVDELVAAIACAGLTVLTSQEREVDPITRNVEFSYDPNINFDSPTLEGQTFNRHTIEVVFYKPIATPKLNPSDLA